jgi:hypothetical protein
VFTTALGQECKRDSECLDVSGPKQRTVWCYGQQCTCRSGFMREGERCGKLQTIYVVCYGGQMKFIEQFLL